MVPCCLFFTKRLKLHMKYSYFYGSLYEEIKQTKKQIERWLESGLCWSTSRGPFRASALNIFHTSRILYHSTFKWLLFFHNNICKGTRSQCNFRSEDLFTVKHAVGPINIHTHTHTYTHIHTHTHRHTHTHTYTARADTPVPHTLHYWLFVSLP